MSQQEFVPREEGQGQKGNEGAHVSKQQSSYRSQKRTGDMPKNEHPSTFESFTPPYSYPTQNSREQARERWTAQQRQEIRQQQARQRRGFSPDGDALENGYRPEQHAHTQQVPPWARPQRNSRGVLGLFIGIMLLIILIKPVMILAGFLFAALAGMAIVVLLVPLLIILFLFLMFSTVGIVLFFLLRHQRIRVRRGPRITWTR